MAGKYVANHWESEKIDWNSLTILMQSAFFISYSVREIYNQTISDTTASYESGSTYKPMRWLPHCTNQAHPLVSVGPLKG